MRLVFLAECSQWPWSAVQQQQSSFITISPSRKLQLHLLNGLHGKTLMALSCLQLIRASTLFNALRTGELSNYALCVVCCNVRHMLRQRVILSSTTRRSRGQEPWRQCGGSRGFTKCLSVCGLHWILTTWQRNSLPFPGPWCVPGLRVIVTCTDLILCSPLNILTE